MFSKGNEGSKILPLNLMSIVFIYLNKWVETSLVNLIGMVVFNRTVANQRTESSRRCEEARRGENLMN